jgi:lysophospholipase L1-like esterase
MINSRLQKQLIALLVFCAIGSWSNRIWAQTQLSAIQPSAPADARLEESIAAFAAADREHLPPTGGVLFVGSSSIRLWNDLESQFGTRPVVIKRGFGGSKMSDCTRYLGRLVIPYKPRLVLVYAGDNDISEGKSPNDVLLSFQKFVEGIQKELPTTRIAYISIKPSPARAAFMPQIRETNRLIERYTSEKKNLDFVDVFTMMLDLDGRPRPELFRADALHLNETGYNLWRAAIAPHLQ